METNLLIKKADLYWKIERVVRTIFGIAMGLLALCAILVFILDETSAFGKWVGNEPWKYLLPIALTMLAIDLFGEHIICDRHFSLALMENLKKYLTGKMIEYKYHLPDPSSISDWYVEYRKTIQNRVLIRILDKIINQQMFLIEAVEKELIFCFPEGEILLWKVRHFDLMNLEDYPAFCMRYWPKDILVDSRLEGILVSLDMDTLKHLAMRKKSLGTYQDILHQYFTESIYVVFPKVTIQQMIAEKCSPHLVAHAIQSLIRSDHVEEEYDLQLRGEVFSWMLKDPRVEPVCFTLWPPLLPEEIEEICSKCNDEFKDQIFVRQGLWSHVSHKELRRQFDLAIAVQQSLIGCGVAHGRVSMVAIAKEVQNRYVKTSL